MAAIETVRVSKQGRDQLIRLKRITGIENWNTLCRWAFCVSIAESSVPPVTDIPADSPVEMTWRTFGGKYEEAYMALLKQRCHADGIALTDQDVALQFRLHLHRGIAYLAGSQDLGSISNFVGTIL